jgi:hypothetical protein
MKKLKAKSYSDFSKGVWDVGYALAPENSVKLGLNLDSDKELGSLVSRLGTTLINTQLVDAKPVLGLHNFRDSVGSADKLFAVVSDGSYSDIYNAIDGTKSLENDTKDLKTRFLTYLDSCLRLNGTDEPKAYNGTAWVTTGGVFDLDNLPQSSKYAVEFKDRVYVAGRSDYPDRVDISGIASSTARTVSWTVDNKFFNAEQEDGGGGITGLAKVPGYVLIFKKRTMKRYDGSSAYPEDQVNQGAPSQEAIVTAQGMCFFVNENGAWATEGGRPKKISSYTVDEIIKSCSTTNLLNVASGTDEEHVFWSFASVTINGETYTNVVLKFNILNQTWNVRKYATLPRVFAKYVDTTGAVFLTFGDDDGNVQKFDVGTTDNGTSITYSMETQELSFGQRMFLKEINRIGIISENISKGSLMWRNSNKVEDWKSVGTIQNEVEDFTCTLKGNFIQLKLSETTDSGSATIKGIDFPEGIIIYPNAR